MYIMDEWIGHIGLCDVSFVFISSNSEVRPPIPQESVKREKLDTTEKKILILKF